MQQAARGFLPVADEVFRLQSGEGPECVFFRTMASDGKHTEPNPGRTRQGIYAFTPRGRRLGSLNSNNATRVAEMIEAAWQEWQALTPEERLAGPALDPTPPGRIRYEWAYPEDGLVLRTTSRDLPEETEEPTGRWSHDHAWFTKSEARTFVPDRLRVGERRDVPRELVVRLARFHLLDSVRGQTTAYDPGDIREAELEAEIVRVDGSRVDLLFRGKTSAHGTRGWRTWGGRRRDASIEERSFDTRVFGTATFDADREAFVALDWVAVGERAGRTRFNGRRADTDPGGMGISLVLAPDRPADRVPPAFFQLYGWEASARRNWAALEPAPAETEAAPGSPTESGAGGR